MLRTDEAIWLLDDLCARGGYCLQPEARSRIVADPPSAPKDFAAAVVRAEGLDPEIDGDAYQRVLDVVERAFQRAQSVTPNER